MNSTTQTRVLVPVDETCRRLSIGKTKLYELIADGQLESVTIGAKRLVIETAIHQFVQNLRDAKSVKAA